MLYPKEDKENKILLYAVSDNNNLLSFLLRLEALTCFDRIDIPIPEVANLQVFWSLSNFHKISQYKEKYYKPSALVTIIKYTDRRKKVYMRDRTIHVIIIWLTDFACYDWSIPGP